MSDWRNEPSPSLTQRLGMTLIEDGFQAAIYRSSIEPEAINLVVYPRNADLGVSVRIDEGTP